MQQLIWEDEMLKEKLMDIDPETCQPRNNFTWEPDKWIPKAFIAPKYIIISLRIEDQKQYIRDFCMIGKFLGLWPSKRELVKWIQHWWKHKGHHDLQIGSKGFFMITLHNLEDINRIFEGWLYNSAGLFLLFSMERFIPEKEYFTHAPVLLGLYSLP
jgi:hypothetical protein